MTLLRRCSATLAVWLLLTSAASAAVPTDGADRSAIIGQPAAVLVQPTAVRLNGPRSAQQLVVTGKYPDGTVRDLTPFCTLTSETPAVAAVDADGTVVPGKNGTTTVVVRVGVRSVRVPVDVRDMEAPQPVSFRQELIAALNIGGCNQGACHGTPSGKNGFKLSLRGYDPAADFLQLTRDVLGRRTDRQNAGGSLLLLKALGKVPHEGGTRFAPQSVGARTIHTWQVEGMQDDAPGLSQVTRLEILPGSRVLKAPARWQQLAVLAHFADGSVRDVTRFTVFSSSENAVATVGGSGLVEFQQAGEVAVLCRYLETLQTVSLGYLEPRKGFQWSNPPENNYVDKHVFAKLKQLSIRASELCTDQEFARRAYLDLCGVLPTPEEVRTFLADTEKNKRARLIDALLERPEYADFWTLKWMDVLRGSRRSLQQGAQVYQKWLHEHLQQNTPFDQTVRELLTAAGNTFENGPANYYRVTKEPEELAESTAQLFLGIRMQCAKCHNHPFERWTQDDYYSTAAFFARVKQKADNTKTPGKKKEGKALLIYADGGGEVKHPRTGKVVPPRFLGGEALSFPKEQDRRAVFAEWLTAKDNPFFARAAVNRLWFHVMGRGIVDAPDDFRDSNPPANEALLDALAKDFVGHGHDLKHVLRVILNSRTYQVSAVSNEFNREDSKYFSHTLPRMLTAEQMLDALSAATEVPEDFKGFPKGTRAIQLVDGEVNHPFLKSFGQPARELPCECEREGSANLGQALQLINGATVHAKLTAAKNRIGRLLAKKLPDTEVLNELYLATLSRLPREREAAAALEYVRTADDGRKAWEDIQWALFNSKEFMFRH